MEEFKFGIVVHLEFLIFSHSLIAHFRYILGMHAKEGTCNWMVTFWIHVVGIHLFLQCNDVKDL
jgi:hypothetical protein